MKAPVLPTHLLFLEHVQWPSCLTELQTLICLLSDNEPLFSVSGLVSNLWPTNYTIRYLFSVILESSRPSPLPQAAAIHVRFTEFHMTARWSQINLQCSQEMHLWCLCELCLLLQCCTSTEVGCDVCCQLGPFTDLSVVWLSYSVSIQFYLYSAKLQQLSSQGT